LVQWEQAENLYLLSTLANPNHWDAVYAYADFIQRKGDTVMAQRFFARAAAIGNRHPGSCERCGRPGHSIQYCDNPHQNKCLVQFRLPLVL